MTLQSSSVKPECLRKYSRSSGVVYGSIEIQLSVPALPRPTPSLTRKHSLLLSVWIPCSCCCWPFLRNTMTTSCAWYAKHGSTLNTKRDGCDVENPSNLMRSMRTNLLFIFLNLNGSGNVENVGNITNNRQYYIQYIIIKYIIY